MLNLDIDGVFADMRSGVRKHLNAEYYDMSPSEAWSILDKVDNLFYHFQPYYGAKALFDELYDFEKLCGGVRILGSAPKPTGKLISAANDKIAWVRKYLSEDIEVVITDGWEDKLDYVNPGDILIDDTARNISAWCNKGGKGILHNPERPLRTVRQLWAMLNSWQGIN
jgi:hypothetical protein